ncbi:hypothetical protein [Kaistia terrae]|uniref:Uncharacterized protein n=1 Tax=Kaistia terrae TaxID=537017 RepID=A0ABW0Q280_9HYPH|nr:hypothetical protein [Kaistia terrae]MCX5581743.1 hypothetical protein [Kaistia terrae]
MVQAVTAWPYTASIKLGLKDVGNVSVCKVIGSESEGWGNVKIGGGAEEAGIAAGC